MNPTSKLIPQEKLPKGTITKPIDYTCIGSTGFYELVPVNPNNPRKPEFYNLQEVWDWILSVEPTAVVQLQIC